MDISPPTDAASPAVGLSDAIASPQCQAELRQAKQRRKAIEQASKVAGFNAWSAAVFAAMSVPFALFSFTALLAVTVLGVVAYIEFHGRAQLVRMDRSALPLLAMNQSALGGAIILYAVWQLIAVSMGQGHYAQVVAEVPELAGQLGSIENLMRSIEVGTYSLLILGTLGFQGGMTWYYLSRRKHLEAYLDQTPKWVVDLQQAAA